MSFKFSKITKDMAFSRNVMTLITGSFVAQSIPIAISPLLTRLYTPEEFGVLTLFVTISTILSVLVTARYEQAILLPEKEVEAIHITKLCLVIAVIMSVGFLILIMLFHDWIVGFFNEPSLSFWLYFIPVVTLSVGVFNALNYYFLRHKKFKPIASSEVYKSSFSGSFQLLLGLLKEGVLGLLLGKILSVLIAPIYLWRKTDFSTGYFSFTDLKIVARRYIGFSKYMMWGSFFNNLSNYATQLLIPVFYSTNLLGFFALVFRVMGAPFTFISHSVGQVFIEEAVREKKENGHAKVIVKKVFWQLTVLSALGFGGAYFFIEELFALIFGEEWRVAGIYAKYMLPFFMIKFIVSPLTNIHAVFEVLKLSFVLQLIMLALSISCILYAHFSSIEFEEFLMLFSGLLSLFYLMRLYIIWRIANNQLVEK